MSEIIWSANENSAQIDKNLEKNRTSFLKNKFKKQSKVDIVSNVNKEPLLKTSKFPLALETDFPAALPNTNIAEITATQPLIGNTKTTQRNLLKKLQARLKDKTVSLTKIIDAYGIIDEITKENNDYEIRARIYDINNNELLDEIIFSWEEFTKSDRKKIVENAIFYWHVGMEKSLQGQDRRVSEFRLRRVFNPGS